MAHEDINRHVGKQLRTRRTMLGLSQEAVGNGIGVASQQVQKYEKGTNAMNAARLCEFAEFLKVPVAYFFEGIEQPGIRTKGKTSGAMENSADFEEGKTASDREAIEAMKSFRRIKDHALRKRVADLLRTMSLKEL
ncbi:MAG TPA: helix-turn-helix transcriptional regulator [Rickettsiales bacterium]|nr:helix-turn-helix transcriptional regulator [Rickettsiales bacterium]